MSVEDAWRAQLERIADDGPAPGGQRTAERAIERHRRQRRSRAVLLGVTAATVAVVAVPTVLTATGTAPEGRGVAGPGSTSATSGSSTPAGSIAPPDPGVSARSGPAHAEIGVSYPFDLLTHCGIAVTRFAGRDWKALTPAPEPERVPRRDGTTVYSGYTGGTAVLVRPDLLRFTIDDPDAAGTGLSFDFVPIPASEMPPPCA